MRACKNNKQIVLHYRLVVSTAEAEGLQQRLTNQLSPDAASLATEWLIGDCIATYWRPHFEANIYPYLPVHITRPKEIKKLYTVHLPERCYFAVRLKSFHHFEFCLCLQYDSSRCQNLKGGRNLCCCLQINGLPAIEL